MGGLLQQEKDAGRSGVMRGWAAASKGVGSGEARLARWWAAQDAGFTRCTAGPHASYESMAARHPSSCAAHSLPSNARQRMPRPAQRTSSAPATWHSRTTQQAAATGFNWALNWTSLAWAPSGTQQETAEEKTAERNTAAPSCGRRRAPGSPSPCQSCRCREGLGRTGHSFKSR